MPTFLHAADLHLDSPLRGLARRDDAQAQHIREASRVAFTRMIDAALEESVSFVLLAGDIYDTQPSFETYLFFHRQMQRLAEAGIPVAVVLGNHDHEGVSPRSGRLPENVRVLSAREPESWEIVPGVWVHGQSYWMRDVDTDLTMRYPQAKAGALNIGLLHTALDGYAGEHARYAPSNTASLAAHGYQYWALGHVHALRHLEENGCHIVYPGNLQGRHVRETGPKGAMFVRWQGAAIEDVCHRGFDDVRWFRLELDVGALDPERDLVRQIGDYVLEQTREARSEGRLAAVRLELHGDAPASLVDLGKEEIRESLVAAWSEESVFLEKLDLDLRLATQDRREVDRYLAELVGELKGRQETREAMEAAWTALCEDLLNTGKLELMDAFRSEYGISSTSSIAPEKIGADLAAVLPQARTMLLAPGKRTK